MLIARFLVSFVGLKKVTYLETLEEADLAEEGE
jgi:hypothetical protein